MIRTVDENLVYGSGGFASGKRQTAQVYAKESGMIFDLSLKSGKQIRILDMNELATKPRLKLWVDEIARKNPGKSLFEALGDSEIAIQNTDAIQFPTRIEDLLTNYRSLIENPAAKLDSRLNAYSTYEKLYRIAGELEITGLRPASQIKSEMAAQLRNRMLSDHEPFQRLQAALGVEKLEGKSDETGSRILNSVIDLLYSDKRYEEKLEAIKLCKARELYSEKLGLALAHAACNPDVLTDTYPWQVRSAAIEELSWFRYRGKPFSDSASLLKLAQEVKTAHGTEAERIAWILLLSGSDDPAVHKAVSELASDKRIRDIILRNLSEMPHPSSSSCSSGIRAVANTVVGGGP
jgi:hypothetical protein